jgi:hypothetical protein
MYIDNFRNTDEEDVCSYDPNYIYQLETQDLPVACPYRQIGPFPPIPPFPGGPQGRPHYAVGMPPSAPPNFTPSEPQAQQFGVTPYAVDPGAIRPCVYRFVYIWPTRGRGFWAWLTYVGRRSAAGFRWHRNNWRYFGIDLREIRRFQCF